MTTDPRGWAFIDTETTGLHADRHEIWELAYITINPDGGRSESQFLVSVDRLADADPIALGVGGFHDRHPQGNRYPKTKYRGQEVSDLSGRTDRWADIGRQVVSDLSGRILIGAVPSFDEERLRRKLWELGYSPDWHYQLVDVEALAAGRLTWRPPTDPGDASQPRRIWTPPWDSDELSRAVGVNPARYERHTALGDCRWAQAIWCAVYGEGMPEDRTG